MKQRITIEQINDLTEEQKDKLWEWWKPQKGDFVYEPWRKKSHLISGPRYLDKKEKYLNEEPPESYIVKVYPLLSIGQMCQFMNEHSPIAYRVAMVQFYSPKVIIPHNDEDSDKAELLTHVVQRIELCDYLWEAVKEVLK